MLQAPFAPSLPLYSVRHSLHPERDPLFHTSKEFLLFHWKKLIMNSKKIYSFFIGSNYFTLLGGPAGLSNKDRTRLWEKTADRNVSQKQQLPRKEQY